MRILDTKQLQKKYIRLMMEVEPNDLFAIAKALRSQATGVPSVTTLEDNARLLELFQTVISRIEEEQADYRGQQYEIWARGKRRRSLAFKREPDMVIGKAYGKNFIDACHHFCTCVLYCDDAYNPRNNTLSGYILYNKV